MFRAISALVVLITGALSVYSCTDPTNSGMPVQTGPTPVYTYQIVNTYPHDPDAFIQGLVVEDSVFYEGTGLNGRSSLRRVRLTSGQVEKIIPLSASVFGEGITVYNNKIIQLTWQSNIGFVYDKETFEEIRTVAYPTEGWGITYDGSRFIMSDGSSQLFFRDPVTFEELGRVSVTDEGQPVSQLNELEYIKGEVYANVWQTDRIARINPTTGKVIAWIDLTGILTNEDRQTTVDVLNGIAYDAQKDRLFVTGKLWPKIFEIKLVPKP